MTRHVFGNMASPVVANYGFRKVVQTANYDVKNLIGDNFYVDNGSLSCKTVEKTVDVVLLTKQALHDNGNIRLHKFAFNNRRVLMRWSRETCQKTSKTLI